MPIGIEIYCASYRITYDLDKGLSWGPSDSDPRLRVPEPNALVASEETIRTYLTDHAVDGIKSIKLVEPKFPKDKAAERCNPMLEKFGEYMAEDPESAAYYRDRLIKYCGVDIQY